MEWKISKMRRMILNFRKFKTDFNGMTSDIPPCDSHEHDARI